MTNDVKDYVSCCYDCSCNKSSNHRKYGFLKPLPIPPIPWHSCSMDFFSQLPLSNGIPFFCLLFPWAFYWMSSPFLWFLGFERLNVWPCDVLSLCNTLLELFQNTAGLHTIFRRVPNVCSHCRPFELKSCLGQVDIWDESLWYIFLWHWVLIVKGRMKLASLWKWGGSGVEWTTRKMDNKD